jgi:hypothetical protein
MLPPEYHHLEPQSTPPDRATAAILRAAARALELPLDVVERLPAELLERLAAERLPALLRQRASLDLRIDALMSLRDLARERLREGGAYGS